MAPFHAALGIVLTVCAAASAAQSFPSRPIRMVVPFPAGGGVDLLARVVGHKLALNVGQMVVTENRAGATGIVGTELVARATPDGHTLLIGTPGPMTIAGAAKRPIGYDPIADFAPITQGVLLTPLMVVAADNPAANVRDLIAQGKLKPGALAYASGGVGNSQHLAGELFAQMAGIKVNHLPYKGTAPALVGIMSREAEFFFSDPSAIPLVRSGKIRALAVSTAKRSPALPDIPTVIESGLPGYVYFNWYAFLAPAKTPAAILGRLHKELTAVLNAPDVREKLVSGGMDPAPSTPTELGVFMKNDQARWAKVIQTANIKLD